MRSIILYNQKLEPKLTFGSIKEAADAMNISSPTIHHCCKTRGQMRNGLLFRFEDDPNPFPVDGKIKKQVIEKRVMTVYPEEFDEIWAKFKARIQRELQDGLREVRSEIMKIINS